MVRKTVKKIVGKAKMGIAKSKKAMSNVASAISAKMPKSLPRLGGRKRSGKSKKSKVKKLMSMAKKALRRR